jgi:GT2 family glycosyltransferase
VLQISFVISSYRKKLVEKCIQSIQNSIDCPAEFVVIENKGARKSIFQVYDEGAQKAKYPILCFLHEDVEILSNSYWLENVERLFSKSDTGVVGVAGSKDLTESGVWWDSGNRLSGAAMHVHEGQEYMTSFGGPYGRVVVVDGVIFLIKKKIYLKLGGYKDTELDGFHFYDVDLCMRAHWAGYRNYTTDLLVRHLSIGEMPPAWEENRQKWLARYGHKLPVHVD